MLDERIVVDSERQSLLVSRWGVELETQAVLEMARALPEAGRTMMETDALAPG